MDRWKSGNWVWLVLLAEIDGLALKIDALPCSGNQKCFQSGWWCNVPILENDGVRPTS